MCSTVGEYPEFPMQDKLKPEEETGSLPNLAGRCTRT